MTPVEALFAIISAIALSAIGIAAYLLRQRGRLLRIVARQRRLRVRAICQRNENEAMRIVRESALIRHARQVIEERNLLRAQLVACTEAPRFPVVTRGSC